MAVDNMFPLCFRKIDLSSIAVTHKPLTHKLVTVCCTLSEYRVSGSC